MAGREQAFSDPEVIRLVGQHFIPVAENCSPLQWQQDAKGEFFRLLGEQGHYAGRTFPTDTRQGYYTCAADGTVLVATNARDPREMEAMLHKALQRFELLTEADGATNAALVDLPDFTPARPSRYPEGGLILQLATRDLPRTVDNRRDDWRRHAWNLDYAWFTRDEARSVVPTSRVPGARQPVPGPIVQRLARFHIRDFARGEPPAWPKDAVRQAELEATILDVARTDHRLVRLTLTGAIRLSWEWRWHDRYRDEDRQSENGLDVQLYGEATWDEDVAAFTAFDLIAAGCRWGTSQYNSRRDDLEPAPLGIAFTLAGDEPRHRTPPHQVNHPEYFGS